MAIQAADLYFVIPTYRLRDVGETVKIYDEHFYGATATHPQSLCATIRVRAAQDKYYPLLNGDEHPLRALLRSSAGEKTVHQLPRRAVTATSGWTGW